MERLCHRNLIQLFEIHESFSRLCLVMECAGEGNLQSRVEDNGPFPEAQAKPVFTQIAAGINHMVCSPVNAEMYDGTSLSLPPSLPLQHANGVTHRDLKPENVLYISSTQIKIGDFGFSTPVTNEALSTFCGSPAFAAPELLQEQSYLGPAVDMWALGVTLYYMVTGNVPFAGNTVLEIKKNVLKGSYNPPTRVGAVCGDLVAKLLTIEPSERPSITAALQDTWLEDSSAVAEPIIHRDKVDTDIVLQLRELGVPVEDTSHLLGEPRTAIAGTYRIFVNQKMVASSLPEVDHPPITTPANINKRSTICTML